VSEDVQSLDGKPYWRRVSAEEKMWGEEQQLR
jgi:hypothetical protein